MFFVWGLRMYHILILGPFGKDILVGHARNRDTWLKGFRLRDRVGLNNSDSTD